MDLFLLSYLVQQGRYHVPPERVAEALLAWHYPDLRAAAGTEPPPPSSVGMSRSASPDVDLSAAAGAETPTPTAP
jgi:hypothetical protein